MVWKDLCNSGIAIEIDASPQFLVVVRHVINCLAHHLGFSEKETLQLEVCIDEACSNSIQAIREMEGEQPYTKVRVELLIDSECLRVKVHDRGKDFSTKFNKAVPLTDFSDRTKMRGYGLQIIKTLMDDVQYQHQPEFGNSLQLIKYFTRTQS